MKNLWTKYKGPVIFGLVIMALVLFCLQTCGQSSILKSENALLKAKNESHEKAIAEANYRQAQRDMQIENLTIANRQRQVLIDKQDKTIAEKDAIIAKLPKPVNPMTFKQLSDCQEGYKQLEFTLRQHQQLIDAFRLDITLKDKTIVDQAAIISLQNSQLADGLIKDQANAEIIKNHIASAIRVDRAWKKRLFKDIVIAFLVGSGLTIAGGKILKIF